MAAAVKRSGRYNYRVIDLTDERCEIVFSERGEEIGRSLFTIQDARRAGTGKAAEAAYEWQDWLMQSYPNEN